MHFQHSGDIWRDFPQLVPGVLYAGGITGGRGGRAGGRRFAAVAKARLAAVPAESELPEIQARRALRRDGTQANTVPLRVGVTAAPVPHPGEPAWAHPLVDLCNAVSLAFAIPVATFDVGAITGALEVRYATGDEEYLTFAGEVDTRRSAR